MPRLRVASSSRGLCAAVHRLEARDGERFFHQMGWVPPRAPRARGRRGQTSARPAIAPDTTNIPPGTAVSSVARGPRAAGAWHRREAAIMGTAIVAELFATDPVQAGRGLDAVIGEMHRI